MKRIYFQSKITFNFLSCKNPENRYEIFWKSFSTTVHWQALLSNEFLIDFHPRIINISQHANILSSRASGVVVALSCKSRFQVKTKDIGMQKMPSYIVVVGQNIQFLCQCITACKVCWLCKKIHIIKIDIFSLKIRVQDKVKMWNDICIALLALLFNFHNHCNFSTWNS